MSRPALPLAALLLLAPVAHAGDDSGDLTPDQLAAVRHDEKKELAKVDAAHGNKKPSEMSPEERRQVIAEQGEASQKSLDKNKVDAKSYATRTAKLNKAERAEVDAAEKRIEAKEEAEKAALAKKEAEEREKAAKGEVVIKRGFNDDDPVNLEGGDSQSDDEAEAAAADSALNTGAKAEDMEKARDAYKKYSKGAKKGKR